MIKFKQILKDEYLNHLFVIDFKDGSILKSGTKFELSDINSIIVKILNFYHEKININGFFS